MRSQLSVWCVQAVLMSGCGVGGYSSVTRWMVVVVVCVGRDVIVWQFCWIVRRRRRHTVHQMSAGPVDSIPGALVRPRHALAAYVRRATTVARNTCCRAASSRPRVRRACNAYRACALDVTNRWTCWLTEVISDGMDTPSFFIQLLRAIPGSGAGSAAPAVSEYDLCGVRMVICTYTQTSTNIVYTE